jgi:hypothetical protein
VGRRGFAASGAKIGLGLRRMEREVLADLLEQFVGLIEPEPRPEGQDPLARIVGIAQDAERPEDPALLRLLPDAYRDNEPAAQDFRRFTEHSLREQKAARARTALATLAEADGKGQVIMNREEGEAWLLALNDVRLTMGTRLGITQEDEDDDERDRPVVYDWLTWLQSTLVDALMPKGSRLP